MKANKLHRDYDDFKTAFKSGDDEKEYIEFSRYFQDLTISEGGWLIDTGSFHNVNLELLDRLEALRMNHPIRFAIARKLLQIG